MLHLESDEEREGDKEKENRCKKKEERQERKGCWLCYLSLNEVCKHEEQGLHDTAGGHTLHLAQH